MQSLRFANSCTFLQVPATATDPDERESVVSVECSQVYAPVSTVYGVAKQWQERSNWAQLAQGKVVYTAVPAVEINTDMRLLIDQREYRIRDISGWPDNNPEYFEIFIEAEG